MLGLMLPEGFHVYGFVTCRFTRTLQRSPKQSKIWFLLCFEKKSITNMQVFFYSIWKRMQVLHRIFVGFLLCVNFVFFKIILYI